jgi:hypothetical protein
MARNLGDQVASRLIHEIKHDQMREGFKAREAIGVALIQFDRANRPFRLARVLRAFGPGPPRRADLPMK